MHRAHDRVQRRLVNHAQRLGAVQPVGELIKRGVLVRRSGQRRLGALAVHFGAFALGHVEHRRHPADDPARFVGFRHRYGVDDAGSGAAIIDFVLAFDAFAIEHFGDARQNDLERLFAENLRHRPVDDVFGLAAKQIGKAVADEAVTQVAAAAREHERRPIDNRLEFGVVRAQRRFGAVAFLRTGVQRLRADGKGGDRVVVFAHAGRNCAHRLFGRHRLGRVVQKRSAAVHAVGDQPGEKDREANAAQARGQQQPLRSPQWRFQRALPDGDADGPAVRRRRVSVDDLITLKRCMFVDAFRRARHRLPPSRARGLADLRAFVGIAGNEVVVAVDDGGHPIARVVLILKHRSKAIGIEHHVQQINRLAVAQHWNDRGRNHALGQRAFLQIGHLRLAGQQRLPFGQAERPARQGSVGSDQGVEQHLSARIDDGEPRAGQIGERVLGLLPEIRPIAVQ